MTAPRINEAQAHEIATWQEYRVRDGLGKWLRTTPSRVVIRRPSWMPWRVFRWFMGHIVIEEREERAEPVPRRELRQHQQASRKGRTRR